MTKKQRFDIYRDMLKQYVDGYARGKGFCTALCRSNYIGVPRIENFPELMAYKPKHMYVKRRFIRGYLISSQKIGYWWSPSNYKKRIQILEEIINSN